MYKVRGYAFESLEQAQIAQKEVEKIRYIRSKTKMDDPDAVLQIYRKLILQDVFETPVGIEFLKGLQEYLHMRMCFRFRYMHRRKLMSREAAVKKTFIGENTTEVCFLPLYLQL